MGLDNLPIFQAMVGKLDWVGQRQTVISQNIANADTPGFKAREIESFDFRRALAGSTAHIGPRRTDAGHMAVAADAGEKRVETKEDTYEVAPSGNSVVLEEQMMAASENAMEHRLVTNLYQKHVSMLRTALGRSGR